MLPFLDRCRQGPIQPHTAHAGALASGTARVVLVSHWGKDELRRRPEGPRRCDLEGRINGTVLLGFPGPGRYLPLGDAGFGGRLGGAVENETIRVQVIGAGHPHGRVAVVQQVHDACTGTHAWVTMSSRRS